MSLTAARDTLEQATNDLSKLPFYHDVCRWFAGFWSCREEVLRRNWRSAEVLLERGRAFRKGRPAREDPGFVLSSMLLASLLMEQSEDFNRQKELLEEAADFGHRYETKTRFVCVEERAMTILAEAYCRHGDRRAADRLYAEVASRLPQYGDDSTAGWCKSWCDRHDARGLMEKAEYNAALAKIAQAVQATEQYGHRNLNKGLTMERMLRMRAEILRRLGRDQEADTDVAFADRIAEHAAKLVAASNDNGGGNGEDSGGESVRNRYP